MYTLFKGEPLLGLNVMEKFRLLSIYLFSGVQMCDVYCLLRLVDLEDDPMLAYIYPLGFFKTFYRLNIHLPERNGIIL